MPGPAPPPRPPRPAVSVVLPFHGTRQDAERALAALVRIERRDGDEIIVVDNTGRDVVPPGEGVRVLAADDEHSAYFARNAGSDAAGNDWLLFVDADCRPRPDILERYFDEPAGDDIGARIGEVVGVDEQDALVARYARSRGHLGQYVHWTFPFRPWGITANLLVRRAAWASVGGFHEGIRSAGDTEFSWRLQDAGWRLDYRPDAVVEHWHRESVRLLARQGARYGAGRAWVMRRYPGSLPRPTLLRPLARCAAGVVVWTVSGRFERAVFKALDAVFVVAGWGAFHLSNTPPVRRARGQGAGVGFVAGAFPAVGDGAAVQRASAAPNARIEASARPVRVDRAAARDLPITWAEDDGSLRRLAAAGWLARTRPVALARYLATRRRHGAPPVLEVAARARRLAASSEIRALTDDAAGDARAVARLIAR